jgi:unsaturated rhamnogalacturonyl hydrolase
MSQYFDREDSIYNWAGEDLPLALEIIANRYVGQHPPLPFAYRAFSKRGFQQLDDGRYDLNLQAKWPRARPGQWAYAYGLLWSENEGSYELLISSYSPTQVLLDGQPVYRSLLAHETDVKAGKAVTVSVHRGWNAFFIKSCKTPAGFGCVIGTSHKRAFPLHFMSPLAERTGQAGWIYSQLADNDIYAEGGIPGMGRGGLELEAMRQDLRHPARQGGLRLVVPARERDRRTPAHAATYDGRPHPLMD